MREELKKLAIDINKVEKELENHEYYERLAELNVGDVDDEHIDEARENKNIEMIENSILIKDSYLIEYLLDSSMYTDEETSEECIELVKRIVKFETDKVENGKLYVLDYDITYDMEKDDEPGVTPSVYYIKGKPCKVGECARKAHDLFHRNQEVVDDFAIATWFELLLRKENISFQYVGELDITFGERKSNYISKNVDVLFV